MRYAGFWRRMNAYGVDAIILQIATVLVVVAFGAFDAQAQSQQDIDVLVRLGWLPQGTSVENLQTPDMSLSLMPLVIGLLLSGLYTIWFTAKCNGATPGKRLFKIRVVNEDGSPIGMKKSIARWFASGISWLPLGFGYLMAGFTPQKTALHDVMCGTRVIHREASHVQEAS